MRRCAICSAGVRRCSSITSCSGRTGTKAVRAARRSPTASPAASRTSSTTMSRSSWWRAPLDKLVAYKRRMGWDFRWVSSFGSSFNYDFHVTIDPAVAPVEYNYKDQAQLEAENVAWRDWSGEQPGMSAFARDDDVFHTYSAYARGFDGLWTMWQWLDRAPLGRNEGDLACFHRHDDTPRPRADRRDTRTYRGDASRGMVDAVHHLRGCRASWHARHDHTPDRVAAGVGGCAPATAREGEGVDPRP